MGELVADRVWFGSLDVPDGAAFTEMGLSFAGVARFVVIVAGFRASALEGQRRAFTENPDIGYAVGREIFRFIAEIDASPFAVMDHRAAMGLAIIIPDRRYCVIGWMDASQQERGLGRGGTGETQNCGDQ